MVRHTAPGAGSGCVYVAGGGVALLFCGGQPARGGPGLFLIVSHGLANVIGGQREWRSGGWIPTKGRIWHAAKLVTLPVVGGVMDRVVQ